MSGESSCEVGASIRRAANSKAPTYSSPNSAPMQRARIVRMPLFARQDACASNLSAEGLLEMIAKSDPW